MQWNYGQTPDKVVTLLWNNYNHKQKEKSVASKE